MYEKYNLVSNPFLEESPDFPMINRKEIMKELSGIMNTFLEQKSPQILALLGDYGIGKTFTLLQLLRHLKEKEGNGFLKPEFRRVLPLYVKVLPPKPPTKYFHYLYSEIVKALGIEVMRKISNEVKEATKGDSPIGRRVRELDQDFIGGILKMGTGFEGIAWAFLKGEPIYSSQMKTISVSTKIVTDEKAESALIEFLRLLEILDYKGLIVLIDEFEYIFTATGTKRSAQLIVTFKELFDRVNEGIQLGKRICKPIFVIACTPGTWGEGIPSLMEKVGLGGVMPFWERIYKNYTLKPFSVQETEELIASRLGKRRIKESKVNHLFPFQRDFVDTINKITNGVPRRILIRTALVLDIADQIGIERIGGENARKILAEHKFF